MRPLLFILGLALVANVLIITNVDAINCYQGTGESQHLPVDCDDMAKKQSELAGQHVVLNKCFKLENNGTVVQRNCAGDAQCAHPGYTCCDDREYCNGDAAQGYTAGAEVPRVTTPGDTAPSTPPVPLLIAVIASAIIALGI